MKLKHTRPCSECPWRKDSPQGYLGGNSPETYADMLTQNVVPPCHMHDHGVDSSKTAMCAGALATAKNACIQLWVVEGAIEAGDAVGRRSDCFSHPRDFYSYHTMGEEYVHPIIRKQYVE